MHRTVRLTHVTICWPELRLLAARCQVRSSEWNSTVGYLDAMHAQKEEPWLVMGIQIGTARVYDARYGHCHMVTDRER